MFMVQEARESQGVVPASLCGNLGEKPKDRQVHKEGTERKAWPLSAAHSGNN